MRRIPNMPGLSPDLLTPVANPSRLPGWLPRGRTLLFPCARQGLYHGWKALGLPKGAPVLIPSFVCTTVSQPLLKAGARLLFFNVHRDLAIDRDHVSALLRRHPQTKALVWYHYLGLPVAMDEALDLCSEHGLYFIEDCAHALFSIYRGRPAGAWGDVAVFSIRKTLPVLNAGALVINNPRLLPPRPPAFREPTPAYTRILHAKEILLHRLQAEALRAGRGLARAGLLRHLRLIKKMNSPVKSVREHTRKHLYDSDRLHQQTERPFRLDEASLLVMHNCTPEEIRRARRRNYRTYLRNLRDIALFRSLPHGAAPLGFSVQVDARDVLRLRLARQGIESATHWPDWLLPPGVARKFPEAARLANTLLTLPCHHGLTPAEIRCICTAVRKAL